MRKPARTAGIVILAALCMFISGGGALGAQDQGGRISMWNRGVFNLYEYPAGTTSVGPNWMGYVPPQGAYNGLTMAWAGKNVGWVMTAEWDGDWTVVKYPTISEFSGNYALFDGLVRMTMGKVRADGGYRFANFDTAGFSTRLADSKTGVLITVQPLRNFSAGAFVPFYVPVLSTDPKGEDAAITYSHTNFGASWTAAEGLTFKGSYRMEPYTLWGTPKGRELAAGLQVAMIKDLVITAGWRWYDSAAEHDLMLDAVWRALPTTKLSAFGYASLHDGTAWPGFKANVEHAFADSPFVAGASVAWGIGYPAWWLDGWEGNPYVRYEFGGSSVQAGAQLRLPDSTGTFTGAAQLSYTIGF